MNPSLPQPVARLAERLVELAMAMEAFANKHTEQLDYEGYSNLTEHACWLKAVARLIAAEDFATELASMIACAEEHLSCVRERFEEGGAS